MSVLKNIKHPMQPDWVENDKDVQKYLNQLDSQKSPLIDERDLYPPYICHYTLNSSGEKRLSILYSKWYGEYDPMDDKEVN